jgi:hypothetical protein
MAKFRFVREMPCKHTKSVIGKKFCTLREEILVSEHLNNSHNTSDGPNWLDGYTVLTMFYESLIERRILNKRPIVLTNCLVGSNPRVN